MPLIMCNTYSPENTSIFTFIGLNSRYRSIKCKYPLSLRILQPINIIKHFQVPDIVKENKDE